MSDAPRSTPADGTEGDEPIRILAGSPNDEETAAIAALFADLLLEQAVSALPLPSEPARSTWDRSRRSLRAPWPAEPEWRVR